MSGQTGWAAADGVVRDEGVAMLPGADDSALVVMGCDPVLGTLETLLDRRGSRRMVAVQGSSGAAVEALAAGRVHAALVHGPEGRPARAAGPGAAGSTWRAGGWGWPSTTPGAGRASTRSSAGEVPLVQREPSASSQQALLRAARAMGAPAVPPEAIADGHLDAARRAAIAGCAAVTFEPAARAHGLRFLPLETHEVELWIDERWIDHPSAQALGDLLSSAAFRERARLVGGYDLDGAGDPAHPTSTGAAMTELTRSALLSRALVAGGAIATGGFVAAHVARAADSDEDLAWVRLGVNLEFLKTVFSTRARRTGFFTGADAGSLEAGTGSRPGPPRQVRRDADLPGPHLDRRQRPRHRLPQDRVQQPRQRRGPRQPAGDPRRALVPRGLGAASSRRA